MTNVTEDMSVEWAWTSDGERWHAAKTKEEALRDAREYPVTKYSEIAPLTKDHEEVVDFFMAGLDVDDVLDQAKSWAYDNAWEDAGEAFDVSDEARAELATLLRGWLSKHATLPPWIVLPENIEPIATEATPTAAGAE